jgi:hypothetical protein
MYSSRSARGYYPLAEREEYIPNRAPIYIGHVPGKQQ